MSLQTGLMSLGLERLRPMLPHHLQPPKYPRSMLLLPEPVTARHRPRTTPMQTLPICQSPSASGGCLFGFCTTSVLPNQTSFGSLRGRPSEICRYARTYSSALVVSESQPTADCLTFLCFPRWWTDAGICAFAVVEDVRPAAPFLQLCREGDELADLLPLTAQQASSPVDTYVAGSGSALLRPQLPEHADVLLVQGSGLPRPVFSTAAEVLADTLLNTREADIVRQASRDSVLDSWPGI